MGAWRGPWYLLAGMIFGLASGLLFAWVIRPVAYTNTAPSSLASNYKEAYRSLIAAAYTANGNLDRARIRLSLLNEPNLVQSLSVQVQSLLDNARIRLSRLADSNAAESLTAQAQSLATQGGSKEEARRLALLAAALDQTSQPVSAAPSSAVANSPTAIIQPAAQTPTLAVQPAPTSTLDLSVKAINLTPTDWLEEWKCVQVDSSGNVLADTEITPFSRQIVPLIPLPTAPSRTPTPILTTFYTLKDNQPVCDSTLPEALLQVLVTDTAGSPLPGIKIQVSWPGGKDFFFTGLKPELSSGYADFVMTPGLFYSVSLADGSQEVSHLSVPECGHSGGANYWGGWLLTFTQ